MAKSSEINYRPMWDGIIERGKYTGKSVAWVHTNDQGYWNWLMANEILPAWGLIESNEPKRIQNYVTEDGVRYLYMYFIEKQCEPSKWL